MWPVLFLVEGLVIGVLVGELARRGLLLRFVAGLVVLACVVTLSGCATKPDTEPASRWEGACEFCRVTT